MIGAVVGLDLSLTSTGIALSTGETFRVQSKGKKTDTWSDRCARLTDIARRVCAEVPMDAKVIVEAPSYGSVGGSQHDRSGLWWMVYRTLEQYVVGIVPVAPTTRAKYATGRGNAGKDEVLAAVVKRYPDFEVTGNDIADAVVLMAMGCRALGMPVEASLPKAALAAMGTPQWDQFAEVAS